MKVFKFGGASVKNPEAIFNLKEIVSSYKENLVIVISAIDNLVKGAAGQAMECYNLVCGYNQMEGIKDG